jgi:hypothetical protein
MTCFVVLLTFAPEAYSAKRSHRQLSEHNETVRLLKSKKLKKKKKGKSWKGEDDDYLSYDSHLGCLNDCLTGADYNKFIQILSIPTNFWTDGSKVIYICDGYILTIPNSFNLLNDGTRIDYSLTIACCGGRKCQLTYAGSNLASFGYVIGIPASVTLVLHDITLNQQNNNVDSGNPSFFFRLQRTPSDPSSIRGDFDSFVQYPFYLQRIL